MLYWLTLLSDGGDVFNLFRYITFRAGGAFLSAHDGVLVLGRHRFFEPAKRLERSCRVGSRRAGGLVAPSICATEVAGQSWNDALRSSWTCLHDLLGGRPRGARSWRGSA